MSFNKQIARFSLNTRTKLHRIRRAVCLKLFGAVILDTPVDTGMLRGNWRYNQGAPVLEKIDRMDPAGSVVMAEMKAGVMASSGYVPIYFCNNLPYAVTAEFGLWDGPTEKVNEMGFSRKAEHGMMRKNVTRFNTLIKIEAAT